jgi:purine-binding chemotaxis protein CheW
VTSQLWVVFRVGERRCALPAAAVIEVMRPQPIRTVARPREGILGVATIRGAVVPVVAAGALFGDEAGAPTRFITLRVADRAVALAVDEVLGVERIAEADLRALPPLLADAGAGAIERIGQLDAALLLVLRAGYLAPFAEAAS